VHNEDLHGASGPEKRFHSEPGSASREAAALVAAGGPSDIPEAPLLDPGVLSDLEQEVPGATTGFTRAFIGLWEQRRARLVRAVLGGNRPEALDATLSLKTSAMMVGALRLAEMAGELEHSLIRRDGKQDRLCDRLEVCGTATMEALRAHPLVGGTPGSAADVQQ
jgi:hypothetical protein